MKFEEKNIRQTMSRYLMIWYIVSEQSLATLIPLIIFLGFQIFSLIQLDATSFYRLIAKLAFFLKPSHWLC